MSVGPVGLASLVCRIATFAAAIVMVAPTSAFAQTFVCRPILQGDSAGGLARRLTGDDAKAYSHLFQIRDPARSVFVPKSRYEQLSRHWQVCVAREILISAAIPRVQSPRVAPAIPTAPLPPVVALDLASPISSTLPMPRPGPQYDLEGAVGVGAVVSLVLFAAAMAVRLIPSPGPPPDLQRAGEAFVGAFVRPLIDPGSAAPPVLVRLRFVRRPQQMEIHLAPSHGRRYPNLRDHKRNVEYDVQRVLRLLGAGVVLSSPLRAEGNWVIVPIRMVDRKQAGVS